MLNRIETQHVPLIVLALSVATLGGAYVFQYGFGYQPCHLCLQERIPYMIAIVASLIAVFLPRDAERVTVPTALMTLCALCFLAGAGLSGFHAGVEYKWWPGPSSCTGGGLVSNSLEALTAQLNNGEHIPQCDSAAWSLFGISLAGYNMLISIALLIASSLPILRLRRDAKGLLA